MTVSPSSQSVVEDLFRAAGKAPVDIDDEQDSEAFLLDVLDVSYAFTSGIVANY